MFSQILIVGACFSIVLYASGMAVACAIPILMVLHTKLFQLEKWMSTLDLLSLAGFIDSSFV